MGLAGPFLRLQAAPPLRLRSGQTLIGSSFSGIHLSDQRCGCLAVLGGFGRARGGIGKKGHGQHSSGRQADVDGDREVSSRGAVVSSHGALRLAAPNAAARHRMHRRRSGLSVAVHRDAPRDQTIRPESDRNVAAFRLGAGWEPSSHKGATGFADTLFQSLNRTEGPD